ncbi:hypothetical protein CTAYLR_002091 [Chrysophaeum taylorii]|uniref:Uncharacterized protein n=1 Tax=Chrysophaeum taylorii TaxID=2483200 RepID=A0AAD7XMX9_9STRA|nr:hypothetical protein CTAYLR_002091 [Chrysophaeum taylorii]
MDGLIEASLLGDLRGVRRLVARGSDVNQVSWAGSSALIAASMNGHVDVVSFLLSKNANVRHATIDEGVCALCIASENGHLDVVRVLLENKADVDQATLKNASALHIASRNGFAEVASLLLDRGADINHATFHGSSPLYIASQQGHFATAELLISRGANVRQTDSESVCPLFIACQGGHAEVARLLLENKADVNQKDDNRSSPLYISSQNGHVAVARLLISNLADVDSANGDGVTPLYVACQECHIDVVRVLLENNADVDKATIDGASPLYVASRNGDLAVARILLANGATVDQTTNLGATSLHIATENDHLGVVRLLLENNADVNRVTNAGASALFVASREGRVAVARLLLAKGGDIERAAVLGVYGLTPLAVACYYGRVEMVKFLILRGADLRRIVDDGETSLDMARSRGHDAVVRTAHEPAKPTRAEMTYLVKHAAVVRLGGKRVYDKVKCIKQNSDQFEAIKALEVSEPEPEPAAAPVVTTEWAAAWAMGKKRSVERYLEMEKVDDGMKARGPETNFTPDAFNTLFKFVGILRTMLVPVYKWMVIDYAQRLIAGTPRARLFMVLDKCQPRRDDQGNNSMWYVTTKWDDWYYRRFCEHVARSELVAEHCRNFEATLKHMGWAHENPFYDEADKDKGGVPKEAKLIIVEDKRGRTFSIDEMIARATRPTARVTTQRQGRADPLYGLAVCPADPAIIISDGVGAHLDLAVVAFLAASGWYLVRRTPHCTRDEDLVNFWVVKNELRVGFYTHPPRLMDCVTPAWQKGFSREVNKRAWIEAGLFPYPARPLWLTQAEETRTSKQKADLAADFSGSIDFAMLAAPTLKRPRKDETEVDDTSARLTSADL